MRTGRIKPFSINPRLPGDKSITHRAYLMGALARGETTVHGANRGDDCKATLNAVRALGCSVHAAGDVVKIQGGGGRLRAPRHTLDLENSGTGLRLLLGVLAGQTFETELTGDDSLRARPMERVLEPLRRMGAEATSSQGTAPVTIRGGSLRGIEYHLPVPSAQIKSALLFAGLQADGVTRITGAEGSRDHTERMLEEFGARVTRSPQGAVITGPQDLDGSDLRIPGDVSAGMFYLAAMVVVPGSSVMLENVGLNPTRTPALDLFAAMGMTLDREGEEDRAEPRGKVHAAGKSYTGLNIDPEAVSAVIDELPALAVAAAFAEGTTRVTGASELRVKESDRLKTVARGLTAIGADVEELPDGWVIHGSGGTPLPGGEVQSAGDHRVAMSFLVAGLGCTGGVRITDSPGIETSDPYFEENLNQLMETS